MVEVIKSLFTTMFRSKAAALKMQGEAAVRRNTIGKVQQKVMQGQAAVENKIKAGAKGATAKAGANKAGTARAAGAAAGKAAAGARAAAGKARGRLARRGGGGDDAALDDAGPMLLPSGAPAPVAARAGALDNDAGSKTAAIDISALTGGKHQRELVGWIVATNGPHSGDDFRLFNGKNVLGTAADCDMVITDPYLSSKHCTIRHEDGNFVLIDLDSTNGTFVNQKKATKTELIDNDTLRIGRTEFKFKALF